MLDTGMGFEHGLTIRTNLIDSSLDIKVCAPKFQKFINYPEI
jgi:hypothetical protein